MSITAAGNKGDTIQPPEDQPPAPLGLRKMPAKGRTPTTGRTPPSKTAPRQQHVAAGTVRAAKAPLEQTLSKPPQQKLRKIEPQKEVSPRRFAGALATPFFVPEPPKSAPKTTSQSPQVAAEKPPQKRAHVKFAKQVQVNMFAKNEVEVRTVASAAFKRAAKDIPKFTQDDAKRLAKHYTIVGSGSERRIVHVDNRTFGDKVRNLFQNRVAALHEFAQAKNLTLEEMKQLPGTVKAAVNGLKNKESAALAVKWIGDLATHERAALIQALPADTKAVLFSASLASMKSDHPPLLLKNAIDGTEPLSETIDKELGVQPIERKKAMVQELIDDLILKCKSNPKESIWKLRLQHILGQYLLLNTGLQEFSKKERNALAESSQPAEFLIKRLSACPPQTVQNLSTVLGSKETPILSTKALLLTLIAQTQKPSYTDWPEMVDLLLITAAWTAGREANSALDKLVEKIFP